MVKRLIYLLFFLILFSCAKSVSPTKTTGYSEDISMYRPVYSDSVSDSIVFKTINSSEEFSVAPPTSSITARLDSLLDSIGSYTRSRGYYTLYTIQVYTGTSSQEANDAKGEIYKNFKDLMPTLEYKQPVFKVKVGLFYEKMDARKELQELKKIFPGAILIPERVYPDH